MKRNGFVFVELVVVFGMLALLIGMTVINVFGAKRKASLTGAVDTLVADLRSQQTKAMEGSLDHGVSQNGYGVQFSSGQYVLFRGGYYNALDSSNAVVPLDTRITFSSILLPDNAIVFASKSGEIAGASPSGSLTLKNIDSGDTQTLRFNHYGVITQIQ